MGEAMNGGPLGSGVSVLVPVYNGAATLRQLVERTEAVLDAQGGEYEIVFVVDGSPDESSAVAAALAAEHPRVVHVDLVRNFGQHNAVLCALRRARYDVTVTMDDDLQHPPEQIPTLLAELARGHDVVYGAPDAEQHGILRNLASRVTKYALRSAMGVSTAQEVSAFRALRTRVRDAFAEFHGTHVCIDVLLTWGTTRFSAVRVPHAARAAGESGYTFRSLLRHAVNMMTGYSARPLQLASLMGFVCAGLGIVALAWVVGRTLIEGVVVQGFAFLASTIVIFSGAQLLALGVIGEYLARMHFRSMQRPTYVVREGDAGEVREDGGA